MKIVSEDEYETECYPPIKAETKYFNILLEKLLRILTGL
jgi:hypothetical protein